MKSNYISTIIRRYFSGDYPPEMRDKLQAWLINGGHASLKEEALQEIWKEIEVSNTEEVYTSLLKVKRKLGMKPTLLYKPVTRFKRRCMYWSAAALFLLCLMGSWWYYLSTQMEWIDVTTSYGEKKFCLLSDSTSVWINAGSTLRYPKSFKKEVRRVYLSGEAWFSVTKNMKQPFVVSTHTCNVKVLGTEFNVSDYHESRQAVVQLEKGKIEVALAKDKKYLISPNQQVIVDKSTQTGYVTTIAACSSRWRNNELIFENIPLSDIIQALRRHFNIPVVYQGFNPSNEGYSIRFGKEETIEQAFNLLRELTESFDWHKDNNQIILQPWHK